MKSHHPLAKCLILLALSTLNPQLSTVFAQGTAFTYQGRLDSAGSPASGIYDLRFALYDAGTVGNLVAGPVTDAATPVSNGLFTVTLDFGMGVFNGSTRWLDIAVRTNGGASFTPLTPRQALTPAPYAVYAASAGSAITASTAASVPASAIGSGTANISITGNAGTATSAAYAGSAAMAYSALTASTATTATNLVGNVSDAQLSANIARLNGTNVFAGTNTFAGVTIATNVNNVIKGSFVGNGGGLTNLNTAQFANSVLTNGETGLTLGGTFSGNGAGLVNLNASQLSSGTVPLAQMPSGVVMNNASSTVLGDLTVNNLYLPMSASGLGTIYLGGNPALQSYGFGNFFVGMYAGNLTMTGNYDTALGYNTLQNNTSGGYNTASGAQALKSNSSGGFNTANGAWALASNTNGSDNTAIGGFALQNNTNGTCNTANGFESLLWNTSGNYNTALGAYSLFSVGTGTNNIGIGYYAGLQITSGNNNIVIGNQGAFGDYNTIRIGDVQTNTVIAGVINGNGAGLTSLNASQLTSGAIPNSRLANSTITVTPGTGLSGGGTVALGGAVSLANSAVLTVGGSGVISSSGGQNPSISLTGVVPIANGGLGLSTGPAASGQYLRSAGANTWAIGALQSGDLPSGSMNYIQNQGASQQSGSFWISGTATAGTFSGSGSGLTSLSASSLSSGTVPLAQLPSAVVTNNESSVTLGGLTLNNLYLPATTSSAGVIYFNGSPLIHAYGSYNFYAGLGAGNLAMNGAYNVGVGYQALNANTAGSGNTASGDWTLSYNTNGSDNTADGLEALSANTSGSYNTASGVAALSSNTTGSNNIALGYQAGLNLLTGSNDICIGNQGVSSDNNIIRIGSGQTATYLAGTIYGSGGGLTSLNANNFSSGTLPLAQLPSSVVTLNESAVTLGSLNVSGITSVSGNIILNDKELQLRSTYDHGVGWYGSGKPFAGVSVDGPVVYGYSGGGLGTVHSGSTTNLVVYWNAAGNVGIGTANPTNRLHVVGGATFASGSVGANQVVVWTPGSASWSFTSDRNAKTGVQPVDTQAVLEKVAELPINEWNYTGYEQRHIGPMAQDFHAAFPLNGSDTSLNDADLHGVALAAIQGLNRKVESENAALRAENAGLKAWLEKLERLMSASNGGGQ